MAEMPEQPTRGPAPEGAWDAEGADGTQDDEEIPRTAMVVIIVVAVALAILYLTAGGGHNHFH